MARVALVTGGSRGIGAAISQALKAGKARVPGEGGLRVLEDAPGSYVKARG